MKSWWKPVKSCVFRRVRHSCGSVDSVSLDPDVALRVRTGLQNLCRDGGTTLLVTSHNMVEVERMCDRVVFIAAGRIVADGTPGDVAASFGGADLESVFLRLAGRDVPEHPYERGPETERPM